MKRGPVAKSAERRKLEGNPGKRKPRKQAPLPSPAPAHMAPPRHLSVVAKQTWRQLYGPLRRAGLLTMADLGALELLCAAYARWRDAEAQLIELGPFVKAANGNRSVNPFYRISRQLAAEVRTAMQDFGLTPTSRARLDGLSPLPPPLDDDDGPGADDEYGGEFAGLIGRRPQ